MARGDHLSVRRGWYTHHAIDLGDGYVVQYGRGVSDGVRATVQVSSYETFSKGRPIEVVASPALYEAQEIALRALRCLGERDYHILWNNCEHFVTWCRSGKRESRQVDRFVQTARTVSDVATKVAVGLAVTGATRLALTASSKLSTRAAGRAATTPWLLAADAAQMIVESTARSLGREKKEAQRAGQAVGAGASAGIGALTGGPAGAAVAVGLWAVGEAVGKALLSGQRQGKGAPGRLDSRLRGNEGHIHDTRTPGVYQR